MLTNSEALILKADLAAKGNTVFGGDTINSHLANTRFELISDYYNSSANPQIDLWRPDVTVDEITNVITMSDFIARTQGQRDAWIVMSQASFINATLSLVRTNFVSIFGSNTTTTNAVTAIAKKASTNFEALFVASGVSSKYKYVVSPDDIYQAIRAI